MRKGWKKFISAIDTIKKPHLFGEMFSSYFTFNEVRMKAISSRLTFIFPCVCMCIVLFFYSLLHLIICIYCIHEGLKLSFCYATLYFLKFLINWVFIGKPWGHLNKCLRNVFQRLKFLFCFFAFLSRWCDTALENICRFLSHINITFVCVSVVCICLCAWTV